MPLTDNAARHRPIVPLAANRGVALRSRRPAPLLLFRTMRSRDRCALAMLLFFAQFYYMASVRNCLMRGTAEASREGHSRVCLQLSLLGRARSLAAVVHRLLVPSGRSIATLSRTRLEPWTTAHATLLEEDLTRCYETAQQDLFRARQDKRLSQCRRQGDPQVKLLV